MMDFVAVKVFDIPLSITIREWPSDDPDSSSRYDWSINNGDESGYLFEFADEAERDVRSRF